jgi:hypothetical protein
VVQGVADHCIFGVQDSFEQSRISIEARRKKNGILGFVELRDDLLKLEMFVLRPADKPHTRHSESVSVQRLLSSFYNTWMVCKTQIVICTKVYNGFSICNNVDALGATD